MAAVSHSQPPKSLRHKTQQKMKTEIDLKKVVIETLEFRITESFAISTGGD